MYAKDLNFKLDKKNADEHITEYGLLSEWTNMETY